MKDPILETEPREIELTRTFSDVENPVRYSVKDQGEHKVGYAQVREFNAIATDRLRDALSDMKAKGADEFVLDLRGNGGGAFQSALGIAGLFMNEKPIAAVVDGDGKRVPFSTKAEALFTDDPLVVWIDGHSASASEGLGIEPDMVGGLPLQLMGIPKDIEQEQFDLASERMKACPPIE
ncbi:unnamed protein product, partial [Choristocarpus tenellus]